MNSDDRKKAASMRAKEMAASLSSSLSAGPAPGSNDYVLREIMAVERECLYGEQTAINKAKAILNIIVKNAPTLAQ
jgi:hypothetical protein